MALRTRHIGLVANWCPCCAEARAWRLDVHTPSVLESLCGIGGLGDLETCTGCGLRIPSDRREYLAIHPGPCDSWAQVAEVTYPCLLDDIAQLRRAHAAIAALSPDADERRSTMLFAARLISSAIPVDARRFPAHTPAASVARATITLALAIAALALLGRSIPISGAAATIASIGATAAMLAAAIIPSARARRRVRGFIAANRTTLLAGVLTRLRATDAEARSLCTQIRLMDLDLHAYITPEGLIAAMRDREAPTLPLRPAGHPEHTRHSEAA